VVSPRVATAGIFAANGAAIATWVAQIPSVQERLAISKSVIGLALLCMAAGALVAMPLTGQLLARRPSAGVTRIAIAVQCVLVPLPLLAPSPVLLGAFLMIFGAANGVCDVGMNAHGVAVEKAIGRPILSGLHGGWSVGGLAGAGGAALGAALGADPRVEAAVAGLVVLAFASVIGRHLGAYSTAEAGPAPKLRVPPRGVVLLGALCFAIMVTEGAMGDWSGIYLRDETGAARGVASLGFAGFSLGMAAGRFTGDALVARLGATPILRAGAALVVVALGGLLAAQQSELGVAGFTLVGLGVANAVPLLFSFAGRVRGTASAPALAAVFTMGYTGFIVGPPVIGVLADAIGLPYALALLCLAAGSVAVLGGRATRASEPLGSAAAGAAEPVPAR
jgi:hypothetical protein